MALGGGIRKPSIPRIPGPNLRPRSPSATRGLGGGRRRGGGRRGTGAAKIALTVRRPSAPGLRRGFRKFRRL